MSLPTILFALNLGKLATESELSLNMLDPGRRHGCDLAQTRLLWTRTDGRWDHPSGVRLRLPLSPPTKG